MKLSTKITFATLITGLSLTPALVYANGKGGHLHQRFERQQQRIENGVESGVLTRREAKKLRREQRRIRKMAREFRADGAVSKSERRKIRKKLNRASDHIWDFKHNDRNRRDNRFYRYTHQNDNNQNRWKSRSRSEYENCRSGYNSFW